MHAISSAGVAHAVTRSCSSGRKNKIFQAIFMHRCCHDQLFFYEKYHAGELENCGCDRSLRGMSPEGFQARLEFLI